MPACVDCRKLSGDHCRAHDEALATLGRELPPPPLGACMIPIVENYRSLIRPGMRVLDIGCGAWDFLKRACDEIGATYDGIDVLDEYFAHKTVATRIENLAELSFENDAFDLVVGNQTMEHWGEYGCTLPWGLYQCFRVCKPSGRVHLNVPIHFHGTREFTLGRLDEIRALFAPFSSQVSFEKWGEPCAPLPPAYPFPGYWKLRGKPAYILDIQAVKDRPLPTGYSNAGAASGRRAQLQNYPASYNVYRVLRKCRLLP
jgi:SAM-dependent methyltransferase